MQGSPPADEIIRFADGSDDRLAQTRWSFSHLRQWVPTPNVSRGVGALVPDLKDSAFGDAAARLRA